MGNANGTDRKRRKWKDKKICTKVRKESNQDDERSYHGDKYDRLKRALALEKDVHGKKPRLKKTKVRRVQNESVCSDESSAAKIRNRRKNNRPKRGKVNKEKNKQDKFHKPEAVGQNRASQFEREFKMGAKLSPSKRCIKWLCEQPSVSDWSKGATPSTVSVQCTAGTSKYVKLALPNKKRGENSEGKNVPAASGKRCKKDRMRKGKTRKRTAGSKICLRKNSCIFKKSAKKRKHKKKRKDVNVKTICKECVRNKWKSRLEQTRKKSKFIYEKKHRTGHYLSREKGSTSLGWAILQVIARLENHNKAYPLKILEQLKSKWKFTELNLVGLNSALEWMRKHKLLLCKVTRNRDDQFQVNKSNPSFEKRLKKLCKDDKQVPRLQFQSGIPHCVSINTQLKQKHHLK
uniref:uncharacterized protein LOC100175343 isoform X2 n=1 Tax=Ciona intestinalis TaxID=7719 RepID=UPI0005212F24|nr:uncharacterized protein LOC100175343 isoform X2 [Ciona intestinalis]|eukprot:XP_009859244.1 uncharacterized protein LOC100175343 isoform X2 [Ciona intestinalis]